MGGRLSKRGRDVSEEFYGLQDVPNGQCPPPPVCPPRHTKAQLIPDPAVFTQLDRFVSNTPKWGSRSLKDLASHLTSRWSTDVEKTRAVFCWVAYNITYDTASHQGDKKAPQDAESVLQTGRAVCLGFSNLFQALCTHASIPCMVMQGINKAQDHDPETVFTASSKTNHAWNLVLVEGEWRPLDNTFGAGHLDRGGTFTREFDEHWFLTDPTEFVPAHFPLVNGNVKQSEKYQLLKRPVTIEHFSAGIEPTTAAYAIGLRCLTHVRTIVDVKRDITIKVKATRLPLEMVKVTLVERDDSQGGSDDSSSVLTSLSGEGTCSMYVRPPRVATYLLKIMGRGRGQNSTGILHLLLSYVIKCSETHPDQEPFPEKAGAWGLCNPAAAECGLQHVRKTPLPFRAHNGEVQVPLSLCRPAELRAELRHARAMETDLSHYTFLRRTEGGAVVSSRLPKPGYYRLRVFAGPPDDTDLQQVADYLLFADTGCPDQEPFPDKSCVVGLKLSVAAECGLKRVKNASSVVRANKGQVQLTVSLSRPADLKVQLKKDAMGEDLRRYIFLQYTQHGVMIRARLQRPGYYRLRLFAGLPDETTMSQAADFLLFADKGCADQEPFPDKPGVWGFQNPTAKECGLKQVRNAAVRFTAKRGRVRVPVLLKGHVVLKAQLKHAHSMQEELGKFVCLEYTEDGAMIHTRLPKPGYYMLRVFAGDPKETAMSHAADFLLCAKDGCADSEPYPDECGVIGLRIPTAVQCGFRKARNAPASFTATKGEVEVPVSLSRYTEIKAQLNYSRSMREDLSHFTFLQYTKDGATIRARLPKPGYYRLRVFAAEPKEATKLLHAADFLLFADKGHSDCKPFPRVCVLACQQQAKLLQPLVGQLPRGKPTLIRVWSPNTPVVNIDGKTMEKRNDGVWEAEVTPAMGQRDVIVRAAVGENEVRLDGLYHFTVV